MTAQLSQLSSRRLRPVELYALDAALAVVAGAMLCAYAALEAPLYGGVREPIWASVATGLVVGLPLAVRRRWPAAVAITVTVATVAALLTGVIPNFAAAAPLCSVALAFYTLAVSTPAPRSLPIALGCLAVVATALALTGGNLWSALGGVVYGAALIAPAWLLGWALRERRASAAEHRDHLVRQAATEERLRIARELHDIVAHTMSLIVVKAAVGNHVADERPQEGREALRIIETTSRDALLEMRRILGALRDDAPYAPTPGLDDLPKLAEQATIGGVDVRLDVRRDDPAGTALPESVGLAVYRIVQEAVTNVVKHAAPARCQATVVVTPDEVRIEVVDDGRRAAPAPREGHGLTGVRERVTAYGGEFTAGPRPGGGFALTARLPYGAAG